MWMYESEAVMRIAAVDERIFAGRGADGDIMVSDMKAYLRARGKLLGAIRPETMSRDSYRW